MSTATSVHEKVVVVTGAGRGLGRAYALHLAAAGASVVVNDLNGDLVEEVVATARDEGGTAVGLTASVVDEEHAERIVATGVEAFGRVDALVNNAGVLVEATPTETSAAAVRAMVDVNVVGSILVGQAAIRHLLERDAAGSIINITSGTHLGQPGLAVYGATKGAIASLTYGWALDLRDTGIRVNALSPLAVTPMKLPPYDGHAQPEEIAAAVQFLVSDASRGVTGQIVRRARDQLGFIQHPAVGLMLSGTSWSADAIAEAFDDELGAAMEPVGLGAHRFAPQAPVPS